MLFLESATTKSHSSNAFFYAALLLVAAGANFSDPLPLISPTLPLSPSFPLYTLHHCCSSSLFLLLSSLLINGTLCQYQNRQISGRGTQTVRLGSMAIGDGGHNVYLGSGPLYGGNTPASCLIDLDEYVYYKS